MGSGPSKKQILFEELQAKKKTADDEREALEKTKKKTDKSTKKLDKQGKEVVKKTEETIKSAEQKAIDLALQEEKEKEEHERLAAEKAAALEQHKINTINRRNSEVDLMLKKEEIDKTKEKMDEETVGVDMESETVEKEINVEEERAESARRLKVRYEEAAKALKPGMKALDMDIVSIMTESQNNKLKLGLIVSVMDS
eukprot:m.102317 g.102317  ORF g.102317 m.102317 type:complete len:198 (+) comp27404_c1_seq1:147-740(+)